MSEHEWIAAQQLPNGNFTVFLGASTGWQPTFGRFVEFRPSGEVAHVYFSGAPYYTDLHELEVTRPADAWNFISSTWTRLHGESTSRTSSAPVYQTTRPGGIGSNMPATTASRSAEPLPLRPMPSVSGAASRSEQAQDPLSRYVHQLSELTGMVSCCVFEVATGREIVHAGASPGAAALAEHGSELLAAMLSTSRTLGLGHALPDAAITLGAHHLLLRAVPKQSRDGNRAVAEIAQTSRSEN